MCVIELICLTSQSYMPTGFWCKYFGDVFLITSWLSTCWGVKSTVGRSYITIHKETSTCEKSACIYKIMME